MGGPPVLLLLAALAVGCASATNPDTYFLFVRSWSPSFCTFSRSADRDACSSASNRFTIHGLWLTCNNGGWPNEADCPDTTYDPEATSALTSLLDQRWPSYGDKGNQAFWEHEWDCHGKCAGVEDGALQTQAAFFSTVLGLDQRYPLDGLIASLQLDTPLSLSEVESAAAAALGAQPIITCDYSRGQAYLDSVYACVDDSLQLTDCGSSSEACRSRTLTVPSLPSHQQAQMHSDGPVLSRALKTSNAGCSHSRIQCEP